MRRTRLSLRSALKLARKLGCEVEISHGTGEYKIKHPLMDVAGKNKKTTTVSVSRKECTSHLAMWLRRIEKARSP